MLKHVLILSAAVMSSISSPSKALAAPPADTPPTTTPSPAEPTVPVTSPNTGGDDTISPSFDVDDKGGIGAGFDEPGSGEPNPDLGKASYAPVCTWTPVSDWEGEESISDSGEHWENDKGQFGWMRDCGDGGVFVWVTPSDPVELVAGASARARARLPLPEPDMSPAAEVGSVVNLGLWFSIADPGVTTARATLGASWAQVQGRFEQVSIDPGDGSDPVVCDGFGEAYPVGSNDPDEGPCGHTYLARTPDDEPHQMTYTITYALTWSTSSGASGSLGTFDRSLTFDYDIDEIQTVGTG